MYYQVVVNQSFMAVCELTEAPSTSQLQDYIEGPIVVEEARFPEPFIVVVKHSFGINKNLPISAFAPPGWSYRDNKPNCHPVPICGSFVVLARQEGIIRPLTKGELSCALAFLQPLKVYVFHQLPNATEFYVPSGVHRYRKIPRGNKPIDHNSEVYDHSGARVGVVKFADYMSVCVPDYHDARLTS